MSELPHERALARWIARVRLTLTVANFAVIWLDHSVLLSDNAKGFGWALAAAGLQCAYALGACLTVDRVKAHLERFVLITPLLDIIFAAILIISTRGYLSPFNIWFIFAVTCSGFTHFRALPIITALGCIVANCLIALIPQERPLSLAVFAIRTGYLVGFAAILSSIGSSLAVQSRMLAVIENIGSALAGSVTHEQAGALLVDRVAGGIEAIAVRLVLPDGKIIQRGTTPSDGQPPVGSWPLSSGGKSLGRLEVFRRAPIPRERDAFVRVLCDRTASSLARIRLSMELVDAAAAAERIRLSDKLHDTYIQTLSALDFRIEVALRLAEEPGPDLQAELATIKQIGRTAAAQARQMIRMQETSTAAGPDSLREIVAQRWSGDAQIEFDAGVELSQHQWRTAEMLVREGLNNIGRHAGGVTRIRLRAYRPVPDNIVCSLENDGDPLKSEIHFGYGLSRLRRVVEEQGGSLQFKPLEAGGAILIAQFEHPK